MVERFHADENYEYPGKRSVIFDKNGANMQLDFDGRAQSLGRFEPGTG